MSITDKIAEILDEYSVHTDRSLDYVAEAIAAALPDMIPAIPLMIEAMRRAEKAMVKYPQPNYVISKWAEETGEATKAFIHYAENRETLKNVLDEVIDSLAMLHRLMVEGDQVHGMKPLGDKTQIMKALGRTQ